MATVNRSKDIVLLIKLYKTLGSRVEGEREAAFRAMTTVLNNHSQYWDELLDFIGVTCTRSGVSVPTWSPACGAIVS